MSAAIGDRWTPERIVRRDDSRGFFEEANPMLMPDDVRLQQALLAKGKPGLRVPWFLVWCVAFGSALYAAWRMS